MVGCMATDGPASWGLLSQVSREYGSMIKPWENTVYVLSIIDGGDRPQFKVQALDRPGWEGLFPTANQAWQHGKDQTDEVRLAALTGEGLTCIGVSPMVTLSMHGACNTGSCAYSQSLSACFGWFGS
jgi:hypothetical protein